MNSGKYQKKEGRLFKVYFSSCILTQSRKQFLSDAFSLVKNQTIQATVFSEWRGLKQDTRNTLTSCDFIGQLPALISHLCKSEFTVFVLRSQQVKDLDIGLGWVGNLPPHMCLHQLMSRKVRDCCVGVKEIPFHQQLRKFKPYCAVLTRFCTL